MDVAHPVSRTASPRMAPAGAPGTPVPGSSGPGTPVPGSPPGSGGGLAARIDEAIQSNVRVRVVGSGPVAGRALEPATEVARELLATDPALEQALRGALAVVGRAADVAGIDADDVRVNGIALAGDAGGHAGNIFAANADDDPVFARNFAAAGNGDARRDLTLALAERSQRVGGETLATTSAGWLNLGPRASLALYGAHAGTGASAADQAHAVRTLRHEAVHLVDSTRPSEDRRWLREALAEVPATDVEELAASARLAGLGAVAPAQLAAAAAEGPYAAELDRLVAAARGAGTSSDALHAPSAAVERVLGRHLDR